MSVTDITFCGKLPVTTAGRLIKMSLGYKSTKCYFPPSMLLECANILLGLLLVFFSVRLETCNTLLLEVVLIQLTILKKFSIIGLFVLMILVKCLL